MIGEGSLSMVIWNPMELRSVFEGCCWLKISSCVGDRV